MERLLKTDSFLGNLLFVTIATLIALPRSSITWVLMLLAPFVVGVGLLFCKEEDEYLPKILWWWDEPDYGINGDPYWKGPEHANGHEREYWWRFKWLNRNSVTGFQKLVLGLPLEQFSNSTRYGAARGCELLSNYELGTKIPADQPIGRVGLVKWIWIDPNKHLPIPSCYLIWKWPRLDKCIRFYMGYKFGALHENGYQNEPTVESVFTINPINKFKSQ